MSERRLVGPQGLGWPGPVVPLENLHGVLDPTEVDEMPSQVVAVGGGVRFENRNGLLGATGAGQQPGNVRCRLPGAVLRVNPYLCDRFIARSLAAVSDRRVQKSSHASLPRQGLRASG